MEGLTLSIVATIAFGMALIALGAWDFRRTFKPPAAPSTSPVDPVDLSGEIRAYRIAREVEEERAAR